MYRIQLLRGLAQRVARQQHELEIWENNAASGVFDPTITTSVSTSIQWISSDGYSTVTTGTNHALSYTVPASGTRRWIVRCAAGLGVITAINASTDAVLSLKSIERTRTSSLNLNENASMSLGGEKLAQLPLTSVYIDNLAGVIGTISQLPRTITTLNISNSCGISGAIADSPPGCLYLYISSKLNISGAISSLPATMLTCFAYSSTNVSAASIAHLTAIRDLRIYSMGWSAANNDTVLLSAWNARATYTYASTIVLHIGTPTGTPGTEPPAAGESNSDWSWNGTRHVPLTGYSVISDLQNDYYAEGFKSWAITIH